MIEQHSNDGQYRAQGGHLYVRTPGQFPGDIAYIHCYQNSQAEGINQLIREYEEILAEEGEDV